MVRTLRLYYTINDLGIRSNIILCTADGRELVINEMRAGDCFG